ncbi:pmvk [Cordylochernes scorpioides]|uniref:Phosphomevalonate kinase n=1 Tax=Cordylochernes scorpioides TaxID=51811 RepID=A0ABY6KWQ0_9ARAC|nr:pmvk [Cordylochernes scorpioides]
MCDCFGNNAITKMVHTIEFGHIIPCAFMQIKFFYEDDVNLHHSMVQDHGLDYGKLLSADNYKENYRLDMIRWSEELRNRDPGFFCRLAVDEPECRDKSVWVVSDCRRLTDLEYFRQQYTSEVVITVRVVASLETRTRRGWVFQSGVDDAESECGLDSVSSWDCYINNDDGDLLEDNLKPIYDRISSVIHL